jgi:hypothetical protein
MHLKSSLRSAAVALALGAAATGTLAGQTPPAESQQPFVHNGEASFVVSYFDFALSKEASDIGACPKGMSKAVKVDLFAAAASAGLGGGGNGSAASGPDAKAAQARLQSLKAMFARRICENPEKAGPDPDFRTVEGPKVPAYGIDLDGQDSRASGKPAPGTCAHDDFVGFDGEHGIDNQFYRAVGCTPHFQPSQGGGQLSGEMLTGSWGILISLRGVDDIRNDNDVEVSFYANNDPIQLSAKREALPFATYAPMQDPRFRATTHGRIVNGVLTTDPVDVRFRKTANGVYVERPLQDARLRATLSPAGLIDGYLAGYTSVQDLYDVEFGYRKVTDVNGKVLPTFQGSIISNGGAAFFGYTCNGAYNALVAVADGHRDPKTGQCTSISTQYRLRAIPAFVIDTATRSTSTAALN